ncbi:MAG: hypothetical protein HQM12_16360 [SAR324 cluster bacterium]|nr:hypothetical protein [SAR324 cluster bacterium]
MFLYQLNRSQKLAFLKLAKHVARLDDSIIDSLEMEMLSMMAKEMDVTVHEVDDMDFEFSNLCNKFTDRASKNICLMELIEVGYSNGNYHPNQAAFVSKIAKAFGFDEAHVTNLENWITSMIELFEKAENLIHKKVSYRRVVVTSLF